MPLEPSNNNPSSPQENENSSSKQSSQSIIPRPAEKENIQVLEEGLRELVKNARSPGPTEATALGDRVNSNLDLMFAHIITRITAAREQLNELEDTIKSQVELSKSQVNKTAEKANSILNATDSLTKTIEALRN